MYKIERIGASNEDIRVTSASALTGEDFTRLARDLGMTPAAAHKSGFVCVRAADQRQRLDVLWNGKETEIDVEPGDLIVTSMDEDREVMRDTGGKPNTYAVKPDEFASLYERATGATEFGDIYRPRGVVKVEALYLSGGFEIMAPWGKLQRADAGYILKNGDKVYGNNKETFEKTYRIAT